MAIEVAAPAKLNLALHVTGQRPDGYHLLDSFVVFADLGDRIRVEAAKALTLRITGPEAAGLSAGDDNLVRRAARAFGAGRGAAIALEKNLPVASGIGGGSADAAAALKALAQLWDVALPGDAAVLALGADVPVCLAGRPARMSGIGEALAPVPPLPDGLAVVLVNPRVSVATPAVFRALVRKDNAAMEALPDRFADLGALADWLARQRNDLEPAAIATAPVIAKVLDKIAATGPVLTRMSGSGATSFGLFDTLGAATTAAARLAEEHPAWWVRAARVLPSPQG
ncbi:4-(cytidine 5'-diphospho)-2-C-methyl-D-erythritol kinase [Defluviimonas sp. SAOS-178_SWC]|uniref:4-(cytidine 5'-diphospho)-2-C-methyl-D-erythritol kinase n=1 Tax=Defluviimonas sp. SAOS-178_SWC TaxID=3121287 RepID=UPI003221E688